MSYFVFFISKKIKRAKNTMNEACRHCCAENVAGCSYIQSLVYGDERKTLADVLDWVERKAGKGSNMSFPGIVLWCSVCRKMSVISYTHYLANQVDKTKPVMQMSSYYTRMCMGAELLMKMQ